MKSTGPLNLQRLLAKQMSEITLPFIFKNDNNSIISLVTALTLKDLILFQVQNNF